MAGVFVGQVGAQQIAAFAPAHGAQLVAAQGEGEGVGGDGLLGVGELDIDQKVSAAGFFFRGSELEQQRIAGQRLLLQLMQASPELFQAPASHRAFFECSGMAASENVEFIVLFQQLDVDRRAYGLPGQSQELSLELR